MDISLELLWREYPGDTLREAIENHMIQLPFLCDAPFISAGPHRYHSGSVLDHIVRCMNTVAGDPLAVWMAFTHDAGKLITPHALWPHHYGHERRGELLAAVWGKQLHLSDTYIQSGRLTARLHMKAGRYTSLRSGTKYDLLIELEQSDCFMNFWQVVDADTRSHISLQAIKDYKSIQNIHENISDPELARQQWCTTFKEF